MKTLADETDRSDDYSQRSRDDLIGNVLSYLPLPVKKRDGGGKSSQNSWLTHLSPYAILFAMLCAVLLMDAIMPLRNLWFHESLVTQWGNWPVSPSLLLFPGWTVIPPIIQRVVSGVPDLWPSWGATAMLLGAFVLVFLVYILALRHLPGRISLPFVLISTIILGLLFMTFSVVTSPDFYSYIAYARIGVTYGLNPLTTTPRAIFNDPVYAYVMWVDQPSAYGPTWTLLTSLMQTILNFFGAGGPVLPMVVALRSLGLVMHLGSVWLVWSIGGSLQQLHGITESRKRLFAVLAFAWNPLLLLEACTNAHNDTTLLFLVLLAIWFLVRTRLQLPIPQQRSPRARIRSWLLFVAPPVLLALGTCLKINVVLLAPGLFFYQWLQESEKSLPQRLKHVTISVGTYGGLIVALYAPFWQGGAILNVFQVNPATYRTINTLPDTLSHLYNSLVALLGFPVGAPIGSPAEHFLHTLSLGVFVLIYVALCWQAICTPHSLRSIHGLVRWMATVWLFYCAVGSPWFWPWYMVTFFGLYALIESSKPAQSYIAEQFAMPSIGPADLTRRFVQLQDLLLRPRVVRLLTLSMFTLYCFATWGPVHSLVPALPGFQWSYLAGVWGWVLPFLALKLMRPSFRGSSTETSTQALAKLLTDPVPAQTFQLPGEKQDLTPGVPEE